jgi:hypothetical protein
MSPVWERGALFFERKPDGQRIMTDVLVIAPDHADLPNAAAEIAAISRHHNAVVLSGVVRDGDIALAVQEGPYAYVWWITHGSSEGVLLSDGLLSIAGVGQYVRTSAAELCVLNTCDSENVALAITTYSNADIICTVGPVDNRDAIRLGSLLAAELAQSNDAYTAYQAVAPPGGPYRYLRAGPHYRKRNDPEAVTIAKIMGLLAGNDFGQPGLVKRVEAIEQWIATVDRRLDKMEAEIVDLSDVIQKRFEQGRVTLTPLLALAVVVAMILMAGALVVLLWINARGGILDGFVGAALSALLFC